MAVIGGRPVANDDLTIYDVLIELVEHSPYLSAEMVAFRIAVIQHAREVHMLGTMAEFVKGGSNR